MSASLASSSVAAAPSAQPTLDTSVSDTLLDRLRATAPQSDATGSMPPEILTELEAAGLFDLLTPSPEGRALPLPTVFRTYERLARADASAAWRVWNGNFGFLGAMLDEAGQTALHDGAASPGRPRYANAGQPGHARRVPGGWSVNGRWPLVSGADTADWFILGALVNEGEDAGTVLRTPLHARQVRIDGEWDGTGLRGAGNRIVVAEGAEVPDHLVTVMRPAPGSPAPHGFTPMLLVAPGVTAITLGVARGALDLAVASLRENSGRAADPVRRMRLARADAALRAALEGLLATANAVDRRRNADETVLPRERAETMASMFHAAEVAADALGTAAALVGSASQRRGSDLERLLRDGATALRHGNQSDTGYPAAGADLLAV